MDKAIASSEVDTSKASIQNANIQAWLLHWGLLVLFKKNDQTDSYTSNHEKLQAFLLEKNFIKAMQIVAPHLLPYLVVALALNSELSQHTESLIQPIFKHNRDKLAGNVFFKIVDALYNKMEFEEAFKIIDT